MATVCSWIKESWVDLVMWAFQKTSISNQPDGTEAGALFNSGSEVDTDSMNSVL